MKTALVLLAGITGLCAAGCLSSTHACTDIGAEDGVTVRFDDSLLPLPKDLALQACIDAVCASENYGNVGGRPVNLDVSIARVPHDTDVRLSVRVASGSRVVFAGATRAHTRKYQPNGSDCDPTVWRVTVTAHADRTLTA